MSAAFAAALALTRHDQLLLNDCMKNRADAVRERIEAGAAVNCRDEDARTPLHIAVLFGSYRSIEVLLTYAANTGLADRDGFTPLWLAVERNDPEAAQLLLASGCSPRARHPTTAQPLFDRAVQIDIDAAAVLPCLLSFGANPWQKNPDGTTAYMRARDMKAASFPVIAYHGLDTLEVRDCPDDDPVAA